MRPSERIPAVLQEVEATWKSFPNKTFANVICDAMAEPPWEEGGVWIIEEYELLPLLKRDRLLRQAAGQPEVVQTPHVETVRRMVLSAVETLWTQKEYQDLRLGQLLGNLADERQIHLQGREIRELTDAEVVASVLRHFQGRVEMLLDLTVRFVGRKTMDKPIGGSEI